MSTPFDLRNPGRPIHVGVVLLNTVTEHLDIAPVGFFHNISKDFIKTLPPFAMTDEVRSQALDFVTHWVTEDGKTPGVLSGNLKVIPTDSFTTCSPLDIILIGAGQTGYQATETEKAFLRKCYSECSAFLSVCGASDALLATGILEGKTATGPRSFLPLFRQIAPGTNWVEKRWVRDEKIWTTGTLLNGLDMIAAFGTEMWGGEGSLVEHMLTLAIHVGPARSGTPVEGKHEVPRIICFVYHAELRRCAKLGYMCTVTGSPPLTTARSEKSPKTRDVGATPHPPSSSDDLVSNLFQDKPREKDQVMQLRELHRGLLPGHTTDDGNPPTPIHTPPSISETVDCEPKSIKINLSMQEAEELLHQFNQRRTYFPFISIPKDTTASSMATSQPFLLLAILTISLTRKPLLQKRLDERFRRVLSERIIFYGEKSMDYVQGLLVYMAWRPLHIRPLSNQGSQFMQILVTMISDLKLTERMHDEGARDVCLGCYSLSSLVSVGFRRRGDDTAYSYLKAAIESNSTPNQPYNEQLQLAKLQILFEETIRSQTECISLKCPNTKDQRLKQKMESLRLELQIFQRVHTLNTSTSTPTSKKLYTNTPTVPLHLSTLSLKVHIALLPFRILNPKSPLRPDLDQATSCATAIRSFFEYFLSIPQEEYITFSIREWCQLILTISASSYICFLPLAPGSGLTSPEWIDFQVKTRSNMLIYLESLSHRMCSLSVTKRGDTPDLFFMFKSVLDIVLPTYAPVHGGSSAMREEESLREGSPEMSVPTRSATSTRCPMMNGSIRQSEFWEAMEQSDLYFEGLGNGNGGNGGSGEDMCSLGVPGVGSLFDDCGDWPSIFSEWVNICNS
ncbi:hypothetical protein BO94DRAFT_557697 [Aspergillus sclerotioniger CBS 115572]|uniref:DJ-1/PfpI domain-containing protein n=1 Tax=Aspergillus sclerotioniger CBS 115572 TaxID=1450535 RepID=A0A317WF66_9EURO|nr:hypothetical protein BO94DRAFT_557697 [Aspergillus sclerotioniger CBS 115572]PWY83872.1 hypothetical protein BO94DRAFT_557697 [Aspergillus sclerotioniger CBS 115572]